jgi:hypothetical protein
VDEGKTELAALTLEALKIALASEKPVALKKAGKAPGLTPGGKDSAAKTVARDQCLAERLGLFEKVGGSDDNPLLRITATGVELLLEYAEPHERAKLIESAAEPHKAAIGAANAKLAANELKGITERQVELARESAELRKQLANLWKDQLAGVERALAELTKQAAELKGQIADEQESTEVEDPPKPPKPPVGPPRSETEDDINFQRDLCRELALVWEDTPEAREAMERVMFNSGLEQVGEPDEVLSFDASQQKLVSGSGVLPGHQVKVTEPGWRFESPRGVLLIVKPKVVPLAT